MARQKKRETTPCPFCGKDAYVKELGRTGKRDNLASYKWFVVIRWHKGFLWARAYYTAKKYENEGKLTALPNWELHKVYRFKPNEAICASKVFYDGEFEYVNRLTERPKKLPLPFHEPFPHNSAEGSGYTVIGKDEIEKSPFRYCRYKEYFGHYSSCMRFLAICCFYPRQVEMLMKTGMPAAVKELVEGRKWNAAAFDWNKDDPLESFQLNKKEMKDYLAGEKNLEALAYYKQFRRKKIKCGIADVEDVIRQSPYEKAKLVIKRLKDHKIEPGRWLSYMARETEAENSKKKKKFTATRDLAQLWIDYINAAETLGYDLANPIVLMPKTLRRKHDKATKTAAAIIAARQAKEKSEKERLRTIELTAKYSFSTERYLIRPPVNMAEIITEGKILKHCVGGYADRHLEGKLDILFLRDVSQPEKPLVTIEMNGSKLVQIHGYLNDLTKEITPKEEYAEILEPWLKWVKAGSKRDKEGNPKLPRRKNQKIEIRIPVAIAG